MIKQVFVKDDKTITGRQVFTYVTKPLLLNQVRLTRVFGQDWKELPGLVSPTFKGSYMKQAVLIMKDRTKLFAEMIEVASKKQGGVVNMHDHVLRLAMDVAVGVFHGNRTDVQRGDEAASKLLHKCRQCTGMFEESKMVLISGRKKPHLTCRTRTLANGTLFIIAAFVQRACDEEYEYKGTVFPKDTVIGVPVLRMHYDPRFWNEPEKLDPDRFSSENRPKINPMAYLPFGAGPRNCVASRYSELLMRVTLATLVSSHKFLPS
ncbi:hypothetical protein HPB52_014449 [Rhipicephalus sanguineus]|uniref:Cytochrome P450 n=1 Tax=Rhipicephalus sanguineus TaxID=34632 RepID=A0A9D4SP13_RHISA|nr:hypothetical protein HPB52_014449 [Rhipicephalus sanguineus]